MNKRVALLLEKAEQFKSTCLLKENLAQLVVTVELLAGYVEQESFQGP